MTTIVAKLRSFALFCCDFVVGDDWQVAVGVAVALAATYGLSRTDVPAWWILPAAIAVLLPISLWRVTRARARSSHDAAL